MDNPPDWLPLDGNEELLYFGRPSKWILVPELIGTIIVTIVTAAVIQNGPLAGSRLFGYRVRDYMLALFIASLVFIGVMEVRRRYTGHAVTTQGVYRKRWIIGRDPKFISTNSLQLVDWTQRAHERIFRVGEIRFYTAADDQRDGGEMRWSLVPRPAEVAATVHASVSGQNPSTKADSSSPVSPTLDVESGGGILSRLTGTDTDRQIQIDSAQDGNGASDSAGSEPRDGVQDSQGGSDDSDSTPRGFH